MEFSLSWADLTNQKLWKRIHFSQSEALKPDPLCLLLLLWWSLVPDAEQGWPIRCSETVSTLANQKLWIRIHFEGCHPLLQQTSHHFKFFCLVLFSKASSVWSHARHPTRAISSSAPLGCVGQCTGTEQLLPVWNSKSVIIIFRSMKQICFRGWRSPRPSKK